MVALYRALGDAPVRGEVCERPPVDVVRSRQVRILGGQHGDRIRDRRCGSRAVMCRGDGRLGVLTIARKRGGSVKFTGEKRASCR